MYIIQILFHFYPLGRLVINELIEEGIEDTEDWGAEINYEEVLMELLTLIRKYDYNISALDNTNVTRCFCPLVVYTRW